jgi:hypothetical protein
MTGQTLPDPEQLLGDIIERQRQLFLSGRKATLEALEVYAQTAGAVADSQEQLADSSDIEWLSRVLRAQAAFTRDLIDASTRFTRELMEEE